MRRLAVLLIAIWACALLAGTASAHAPGSDGGFTGRGCRPLHGVSQYGPVGVTAYRVSCRLARRVARGSVRGQSFERWRCTGKRTSFGHCHGRGIRRGAGVGWYAYH